MTYPDSPGAVRWSKTSVSAAESIKAGAGTIREWIYVCIAMAGQHGMTCDEIEAKLRLRHQTVSARLRELSLFERIKIIGQRETRSGRQARVYVIKSK